MDEQAKIGRITIAQEVLETTARLTTLAVPGVARLVAPRGMRRLLRHDGVVIDITDDGRAQIKLYVVTDPDVNMLTIGRQIQAEVTRAIQDMLGIEVESVDIYIEDVAYPVEKT